MRKVLQFLFHRVVLVALCLVVQLAALLVMILYFNNYFTYFYAGCIVISVLVTLYILNNKSNPAYKIAWLIPILLAPLFGGLFYLMFGANRMSTRQRRKMALIGTRLRESLAPADDIIADMAAVRPDAANQSRYIQNYAACPPYRGTQTEYLPLGEVKFQRMLEELRRAEHYIFMEYFIVEEGRMWSEILAVLEEKVRQGVDVRLLYDDMGPIMLLPPGFRRHVESLGIRCCVFNPFIPVLSVRMNNRDHRKICVIDGHTGITGGINIGDEYINDYPKHGHWKDTSILLRGEAVWSLTVMFLTMWDYVSGDVEDYEQYRPAVHRGAASADDGVVQPYTDSPLDGEPVGQTVYLNIISKAEHYVYITTPYLIIDSEMTSALSNAAKAGVDVRIITPHVPDKWFVHAVTRSNYETLVETGVKIYEYTPGFIHAKTFVADDEYAVVGTINLDYRSLFLHFECGAWLWRTKTVRDIREDFEKTLGVCEQITLEKCRAVKWYRRFGRSILRVFAPLM